jgi:glycosyltransferase involved in cell wall biosynthesis
MLGWELPPHNSGGLGVACYYLARALSERGANIDFVVPYSAKHPNINFMKIHSATPLLPLYKFGMGAYDGYSTNTALSPDEKYDLKDIRGVQRKYIKFVEGFVKKHKPDVIHAHDWLTMEAGMRAKALTNAPLVIHVHATEFDRSGASSGNPIVHDIEYQGLMMADRIIAVSNYTKKIIVAKYGIPADKIEVLHNAIDPDSLNLDYFCDDNTYKYIDELKQQGYKIVTTVTRFTVQKGLSFLMKAAAKAVEKYDKLVFLFVGDGEQRNELIQMAADLGIADKVFFTGFVRGKHWRDAYAISDIFVMSSVSEPFGITALEAAHYNNALIITKQSGVSEVLGSIFKYDFWDVDKLADEIVNIALSPALEGSLKSNIKNEYARISWGDVADRCMNIYKNMVSMNSGRSKL